MKAHAGLVRLKPALVNTTNDAREAAALEAFGLAKVRAAMMTAGGQGFTSCAVGPRLALNLKETTAAKDLIEWLTDEKFQHRWEQRAVADPRPGGEPVFDLVVTW